MAKFTEHTRYGVTDLSDMELSVLTAGLAMLVSQVDVKPLKYPEYRERANELLRVVNPALLKAIEKKREEAQDARRTA